MSIVKSVQSIMSGEVLVADILETALRRIDAYEPQLRAWVEVDQQGARKTAECLDQMVRDGKSLGP